MGRGVLALVLLLPTACSGSTANESLVSFDGSPCKSHLEVGIEPRAATEDYEGLQCIVWEPTGETLTLTLTNFDGGCGIPWEGSSSVPDPNTVELLVANNSGGAAGCGSCIYDWVFEIAGVDTGADVSLTLTQDPGEGFGSPDSFTITLPLSTTTSGSRCTYVYWWALEQYAGQTGNCGKPFMTCGSQDFCDGLCQMDLTCAPGDEAGRNYCHVPCASDSECDAYPGASCQDGLCRPANPW